MLALSMDFKKEAQLAILEGIQALRTPRQLRILFIHLLVNDCILAPQSVWEEHSEALSRDFILHHNNVSALGVDDALEELARYLEEYGKSLTDYGLPEPSYSTPEVQHEMEQWNGQQSILAERANAAIQSLNPGQQTIYNAIFSAAVNGLPLYAFIDGQAGRGKTFLVNAICDKLRSLGHLVLPTVTAAYAAQLYPGGRTTHSTFKVPVNENNELLVSPIEYHSPRAELLRRASVIISDEAPMANRAVLACVEETCRRVMANSAPFGGKTIVLLGDFRQTCPVIRRGTRAQVIDVSIKSSPLWPFFTIFRLATPIRNAADPELANFVDAIGDGAGPEVRLDLLDKVTSMEELIDFVFLPVVLADPEACLRRSILAPTNLQIDTYNNIIINCIAGAQRTYLAADSLKEVEEAGIESPDSMLDYVARQTPPGLPPHSLTIKVNAVYRLLRNLSLDRGLVKNVRVVIVAIGSRLVTVRILRGVGGVSVVEAEDILIPRITFTLSLPSGHTLLRRQFPLAPAYATTSAKLETL
ncbi:ATP-dependent DNA helicase pif1 [Grifola frondosa]|uniref:ATP-dependent DNA helicase n=1 Tax=Grifola frondosa TaxID=5627 RepID=A0A1C7MM83_GRIFR|nr:ATP-dependent DNA helicase pif1 [Grifola frondosa]